MPTTHPPINVIRGDLIKVLFFDVFGTCVQQRTPVADELFNAAKEAIKSGDLDEGVRRKADGMVCFDGCIRRKGSVADGMQTYNDWFAFGGVCPQSPYQFNMLTFGL